MIPEGDPEHKFKSVIYVVRFDLDKERKSE